MSTEQSLNERSIQTHGKVIDNDNRPVINGEGTFWAEKDAACLEKDSIATKATTMMGELKEKITNAFDNVKEAFTSKTEAKEVEPKTL